MYVLIQVLSISESPLQEIVWIVGSSIIYWAHRRAVVRPVGKDLGLNRQGVDVVWHGVRGLKTDNLRQELDDLLSKFPKPSAIVLHAGANDVTSVTCIKLTRDIKKIVKWIAQRLPSVTIIWSHMLSRVIWRGANRIQSVEKARKRVNAAVGQIVIAAGGKVLHNPDIDFTTPGLYRTDGVHLSDIGNDIFLNDLQGGLETFIVSESKHFPPRPAAQREWE
jgi:lysophospholipase L1-like esterase